MLENILKNLEIEYDEIGKRDDTKIYVAGIKSFDNNEADVLFIEDSDVEAIVLQVPEIIEIDRSKMDDYVSLVNQMNCTALFGTYLILDDYDYITFKLSHSIIEGSSINEAQLSEYIGMIGAAIDTVIENIGLMNAG